MTTPTYTRIEHNCETGVITEVRLTAEEIAQLQTEKTARDDRMAALAAEDARVATIKTSAKAKLVAGEPLTEEEASVLVI